MQIKDTNQACNTDTITLLIRKKDSKANYGKSSSSMESLKVPFSWTAKQLYNHLFSSDAVRSKNVWTLSLGGKWLKSDDQLLSKAVSKAQPYTLVELSSHSGPSPLLLGGMNNKSKEMEMLATTGLINTSDAQLLREDSIKADLDPASLEEFKKLDAKAKKENFD